MKTKKEALKKAERKKKPVKKKKEKKVPEVTRSKTSNIKELLESGERLKKKLYLDLLVKVKDGTIKNQEMQTIKNLETELQAIQYNSKPDEVIASTRAIAKLFDVKERQIHRWVNSGCPKVKPGFYNVKEVLEWWLKNIWEETRSEAEDTSILESKRIYWKAKASREEVKHSIEKGSVVVKEDISKAWALRLADVRKALLQLPDRLAPSLEGQDYNTIREEIRKEAIKIMETYQRRGKFCEEEEEG